MSNHEIKKIGQPSAGDVLGKLPTDPKPKLEKVEVPPIPVPDVSVGFFAKLSLWASSWFRNETLEEYEGKHDGGLPNILGLLSGNPIVKIIIGIIIAIVGYFLLR